MSDPAERWRWVPDYEGLYLVSDMGRVFAVPRNTSNGGFVKAIKDSSGYPKVALSKNGCVTKFCIHRIEAIAFLGERGAGYQVNHIDGNRSNNNLRNLEWCTQQENIRHELYELGSIYRRRKLTSQQAREAKNPKEPNGVLADRYRVSKSTIQCIKNGKLYKEV